jgi:hypothetical protein
LYTFESEVLKTGIKQFQLKKDSPKEFIIVLSAKFNDKVTEMGLFNLEEQNHIIRMAHELYLNMKIPDMRYCILNTFENLVDKVFFEPQETLKGMCPADIYLSDYQTFRLAINKYKPN